MKCNIEFNVTPQEARQFFGLPDLQPLQASVMAEMERKMLAEMERFSPDGLLKSWLSMCFQTPEQFRDAFAALMKGMGTTKG